MKNRYINSISAILILFQLSKSCSSEFAPVYASLKDMTIGRGAAGVPCDFSKLVNGEWVLRAQKITSATGLVSNVTTVEDFTLGDSFSFVFYPENYWAAKNMSSFFPRVEIQVEKTIEEDFTTVILLSPYSYYASRGHLATPPPT